MISFVGWIAAALLLAKADALRMQGIVPQRQGRPLEKLQDMDLHRTQHARIAASQWRQPAVRNLCLRTV